MMGFRSPTSLPAIKRIATGGPTAGSGVWTANLMKVMPVSVPTQTQFVFADYIIAVTSGNVAVAVYDFTTGLRLFTTGSVAVGAIGPNSIAIDWVLPRGNYKLGIAFDNAIVSVLGMAVGGSTPRVVQTFQQVVAGFLPPASLAAAVPGSGQSPFLQLRAA